MCLVALIDRFCSKKRWAIHTYFTRHLTSNNIVIRDQMISGVQIDNLRLESTIHIGLTSIPILNKSINVFDLSDGYFTNPCMPSSNEYRTFKPTFHLDFSSYLRYTCMLPRHYDRALFRHTLDPWNLLCWGSTSRNQSRKHLLALLLARHLVDEFWRRIAKQFRNHVQLLFLWASR